MIVRRRVEGLPEALCPGCHEWKLLSHFDTMPSPADLLSNVCQQCARKAEV